MIFQEGKRAAQRSISRPGDRGVFPKDRRSRRGVRAGVRAGRLARRDARRGREIMSARGNGVDSSPAGLPAPRRSAITLLFQSDAAVCVRVFLDFSVCVRVCVCVCLHVSVYIQMISFWKLLFADSFNHKARLGG